MLHADLRYSTKDMFMMLFSVLNFLCMPSVDLNMFYL